MYMLYTDYEFKDILLLQSGDCPYFQIDSVMDFKILL